MANGKLQIALEMGKLSAWERDLETNRMTGTATFMATLGLPSDAQPTFDDLERIFHPADMERIRQAIAYAERTNTRINIEHRIIKPDGRITRIQLGPYEDGARNRVLIEGPHVELPSEAAVPIGMAVHELTTNAAERAFIARRIARLEDH